MSKIKNTRELVLRAEGHARHDHIIQGTYGEGSANGHVEFKGCAIGCLATPHRKRELRAWLRRFYGVSAVDYDDELDMVRRLEDEFGICKRLAREAEDVFESLPTHGMAIEFIPAFARALREGRRITNRSVAQFQDRTDRAGLAWDYEARRDALLDWLSKDSRR